MFVIYFYVKLRALDNDDGMQREKPGNVDDFNDVSFEAQYSEVNSQVYILYKVSKSELRNFPNSSTNISHFLFESLEKFFIF